MKWPWPGDDDFTSASEEGQNAKAVKTKVLSREVEGLRYVVHFSSNKREKFAVLVGLRDEDMGIYDYHLQYSSERLMRYLEKNVEVKSHESPEMFSTSVNTGEIWKRSGLEHKEPKNTW